MAGEPVSGQKTGGAWSNGGEKLSLASNEFPDVQILPQLH